ncbi:MAG: hypothetical protein IKU58_02730 [Clostridia bacterium]|nr:hypothetical protein [Clostridia bacterium]
MSKMKQLWPRSFEADSVKGVLVALAFYVILNIIVGFVVGLLEGLPILGFAFKIFKAILLLYVFTGISLAVLNYFGIVK